MSVNVGATISNIVELFPSPVAKTLTAPPPSVSATSNNAVNVGATVGTRALTPLSAQVNEDVIARATLGTRVLASLNPTVDFVPVQGDVTVDVITATKTLTGINPQAFVGGLVETLPDWNDEDAYYTAEGLPTTSANLDIEDQNIGAGLAAFQDPRPINNTHNDTEGDFLWLAYHQHKRLDGIRPTSAGYWLNRRNNLVSWFNNDYVGGTAWLFDRNSHNHDHLYGWGLCDYFAETNDATSLTTIRAIRADVDIVFAGSSPGDPEIAGNGGRRWARQLRFAARLAEVDPASTSNQVWADKVIDIVLDDPEWEPTFKVYARTGSFDGLNYANGDRAQNTFHMGLMMEALYIAWRWKDAAGDTTRANAILDRLIDLATFYKDVTLDGNGFLQLQMGYNINTTLQVSGGGTGSPAGVYTVPPIGGLVLASRFTDNTDYLDRAKLLWLNWQSSSGLSPPVPANNVQHFTDSKADSSTGFEFIENNKGELQYNWPLFGEKTTITGYWPVYRVAATDKQWTNVRIATGQGDQLRDIASGNVGNVTGDFQSYPGDEPLIWTWNNGIGMEDHYAIVAQGGHRKTSDNGAYVFGPFNSDTPNWHRAVTSEFNISRPTTGQPYYPSGNPASRHGYGHSAYIPPLSDGSGHQWFAMVCGAPYGDNVGGNPSTQTFNFNDDPTTGGTYDGNGVNQNFPNSSSQAEVGICDWDPIDEVVYAVGGSGNPTSRNLHSFDPRTRLWTVHPPSPAFPTIDGKSTGVVDPVRRIFVGWDTFRGNIQVYDIGSSHRGSWFEINASGTPLNLSSKPGFAYDPVSRAIFAYDGGTVIKKLNIPANFRNGTENAQQPITVTAGWSWTAVTGITGTLPPDSDFDSGSGTYGKFRYIKSIHAFAMQAYRDSDMFIFPIPKEGM